MRGACPPLTWWPSAEAAADPGGGGSSPRQRVVTQGRRDAAENVREQRWRLGRRRWGGCSSGGVGGGGSRGAGSAPVDPVEAEAAAGTGPGLSSLPAVGGGQKGSVSPPPDRGGPSSPEPSRLAWRRLGAGRFVGLGLSGPNAEEGRVPCVLGGAVHQRAAGGPQLGRAWEAGRARPSQEDNAAAPARRSSGTSSWRPGATRGGTLGQRGPVKGPVWPSWTARQQRLMPQPRLLHLTHDGAPCSK